MAPPFSLFLALTPTSSLRPLVEPGMGAFLARDKKLIDPAQRTRIGDSLDLDRALKLLFPTDRRWDYVFSVPTNATLVALEPHHAKDSEISVLIEKKKAAAVHLRAHLDPKRRIAKWLWVSHGKASFSRMERTTRLLAQAGITYVGRSLTDLD